MTTLITGANGFVGSALAHRLVANGHRVRVLVRPTSDRRNLEGLPVETVFGDLTEPASLDRAVAGCKVVFHVAADYRLWVPDPQRLYAVNVTGTRNLMVACGNAGVERIVYTSSVATLGTTADGSPADETMPTSYADMIGHYKRSKFMAETEVRALAVEQGLPVVIVNPSTPIGPRDIRPTPTGRMVAEAVAGRLPAYVDTGLNVVHVDDVALGHVLAFERGRIGERYILGGENLMLKQILAEIARILGRRAPRLCLPHSVAFAVAHLMETWAWFTNGDEPLATVEGARLARKHMFFSSEKARRELGFVARPAQEALCDAVAWFRDRGAPRRRTTPLRFPFRRP